MNETTERLAAVRELLTKWDIDGLFINSSYNYRWLSGFTGSNCVLLITNTDAYIGTDFRYWEQAAVQAPEFQLIKTASGGGIRPFATAVDKLSRRRLGIEANAITLVTFDLWQRNLEEVAVTLVPFAETLEPLRLIKSPSEIEIIRRAAAITDKAMSQVNDIAKLGMTEKALAWELEKIMREEGADGIAFDIIVAAGENAAKAHHRPSSRPLQLNDAIVIDMGAKINGYHSDLTRSFFMGNELDDKFQYVYDLVHTAQKNALNHMRSGMSGKEIDALARDVIEDAGQGEHFGHSLGHGVGLFIHEGPRLSRTFQDPIEAGTIVTVEPGVYLPGWGGVRIEDLVLVTEDGIEFLSHCPKNPIIPV